MKYNHGAIRRRFREEQTQLSRQYRSAGMSEEAIQEMYEFDLAVFKSDRNDLSHKAEIEEMTSYDRITGDSHYMDMDEFPAIDTMPITSHRNTRWIEEITNIDLYNTIKSFNDDYIKIISMKMDGVTDARIAATLGCERSNVTHKIALIKNKFKKFLLDTTF